MASDDKFTIKPFNTATGYIPWKATLTAYIVSRKLERTLRDPPDQNAQQAEKDAFTEADNSAKAIILNSLSEEEVVRVMNEATAKGMLAILDAYHTSKSATSLAVAMAKHKNIRIGEGGDISKHLSEYDQICDEIRTLRGTISEEQKAWGALLSLPPSWRVTVAQIANRYKDKANGMTYRNVRGDLLLEGEFNRAYDTSLSSKLDEAKVLFTKGPPVRDL